MNNNKIAENGTNKSGFGFIIILAITVVLLIGTIVALFIVMNIDNKKETETENTTDSQGSVAANLDVSDSVAYPTNPTRSNYIIEKNDNVTNISSDSKVNSGFTILVDLDSFTSIAEKNADEKVYPASMTKVMTLIVACENLKNSDLTKTVNKKETPVYLEVLESHVAGSQGSGNGAALSAGEWVSIDDLIYLISADSNAIACLMIAEYVAGSVDKFVGMMNAKAAALGLTKTNFENPIGFHHADNYTTCREMASIMAYAIDNQKIVDCMKRIVGGYSIKVYTQNDKNQITEKRSLRMYLGWLKPSRFNDDSALKNGTILGAKTGYETSSSNSLVSYAEIDGKRYINVIVAKSEAIGTTVNESTSSAEVRHIYNTYAKEPEKPSED